MPAPRWGTGRPDPVASGLRKQSTAWSFWEEHLRRAPDGLEQRLRERIVPLVSGRSALERSLGEHRRAEKKLASANAKLRRRIADGRRLESAFANAPIGMALLESAPGARWCFTSTSRASPSAIPGWRRSCAGFGSFYYLKNLPFDYIKIDGDLIRGLAASHMDQLVVGAIVGIAHGMGKKTVAEFVTDEETVRLLAKAGVDCAQGYHVGRPRPLRDALLPA